MTLAFRPHPSSEGSCLRERPLRLVPGLSFQCPLAVAYHPSEGRAPPRPKAKPGLDRGLSSSDRRALDCPSMIMLCLALRSAPFCGRGDRAPPAKPPSPLTPGISPQGHLCRTCPPLGGAGSARPKARASYHRRVIPVGHLLEHPNPRRHPVLPVRQEMPGFAQGLVMRTRRAHPLYIILVLLGDSMLGAGRGVPDADASLGT